MSLTPAFARLLLEQLKPSENSPPMDFVQFDTDQQVNWEANGFTCEPIADPS